MRTRRWFDKAHHPEPVEGLPISLITVTLFVLCIFPSAHAQTLKEIFDDVLASVSETPLPSAICPLVEAAQDAGTNELAALEIAVAEAEHRITVESLTAIGDKPVELERQKKACAQIKAELTRIKNERTAWAQKVREAREGGRSFAFHGRFELSRMPNEWDGGDYNSWLIRDNFGELPGDEPNGPVSAVVSLASAGCEGSSVMALDGKLRFWGNQDSYYRDYPRVSLEFDLESFGYQMGSFELFPGVWTGTNSAVLNPFGSPPVGQYNFSTDQFEMRLEGIFTNDLYDHSMPILFFASIFGGVSRPRGGGEHDEYATAGAPILADVPMLVPLRGDRIEAGLPKVMGAHVLEFNAEDGTLRLLENTTLQPNADIAMVRYRCGGYTVNPSVDAAVGAQVVVDPFSYTGESPPGVFNFSDVAIHIDNYGCTHTLLTGFLRNPVLDAGSGGFFAQLEITEASDSSTVLRQIHSASGTKVMQIAVGAAAYDLVELTDGFTVSGRLPWPELFHLGVVRDCDPSLMRADFDGDGSINFKDFANLAQYWLQDGSSADLTPLSDGGHSVNMLDLFSLVIKWLERCK
jgi:hypothetical protein